MMFSGCSQDVLMIVKDTLVSLAGPAGLVGTVGLMVLVGLFGLVGLMGVVPKLTNFRYGVCESD